MTSKTFSAKIDKVDLDERIVTGAVYVPLVLDSQGEFMFPEDLDLMIERFNSLDQSALIDTAHNQIPNGSYPIASYRAPEGDPMYEPGTWVMSVKIEGDDLWRQVKEGELNGFSFEAMVDHVRFDIDFEIMRDHVGLTEVAEDHTHIFFAQVDQIGRVCRGMTDKAEDGHFHAVVCSTRTTDSEGHNHRFFL